MFSLKLMSLRDWKIRIACHEYFQENNYVCTIIEVKGRIFTLWFTLHIRIRAAEGFVFTVELRRSWWSQGADLIIRESGQNHHRFFYYTESVRTVLQLCFAAGSCTCGGNRLKLGTRHMFCKETKHCWNLQQTKTFSRDDCVLVKTISISATNVIIDYLFKTCFKLKF